MRTWREAAQLTAGGVVAAAAIVIHVLAQLLT